MRRIRMVLLNAMDKNKKIDPTNKDCANCGTSGAKLTCGKCKSACYCSKACQKQHWTSGHKGMCIAPDKRRPEAQTNSIQPASGTAKVNETSECPICLDFVSEITLCTLPCKHEFHRECVEELRKHGVLQACPLCREALPAGAEKLCEDAIRMYIALNRKVESGRGSWQTLTTSQEKLMAEVVAMWTTAANQGHAAAQFNLGRIYRDGEGVFQDFKESVRWTRKAADQGESLAQYNLGVMYRFGEGVSQDNKEAVRWIRKAAHQGNDQAQSSLAAFYREGEIVPQDLEEAARWTRKAADLGHEEAQYSLGIIYLEGEGVPQDFEEAARWILKAADQGHDDAQFNLSIMYREGDGVTRDFEEAARWTRKAAEQGHADAQYNLGIMYRDGEGVPRDLEDAARWTRKAANQGHAEALRALVLMARQSGRS